MLFDRTIHQIDAAPQIEEISDSVLVSEHMEASSSMRLFRTNSCDNPVNTTEELCNLNAEDLCNAELKFVPFENQKIELNTCPPNYQPDTSLRSTRRSERLRSVSMRLSDLQQHINVTLSPYEDDVKEASDSLVSELKVDPPDEDERPIRKRCSIGTPDETEADLCRQCAGCKNRRSLTPLGHLPPLLDRIPFVDDDRLLPLDFSDYDRLRMYASLEDVLSVSAAKTSALESRESRKKVSFNVPSPGPLFLLNNRYES